MTIHFAAKVTRLTTVHDLSLGDLWYYPQVNEWVEVHAIRIGYQRASITWRNVSGTKGGVATIDAWATISFEITDPDPDHGSYLEL